ncbi:MAG: DNA polymerase III subunit beta [Ignavibacteria bacterium]|jgi:DNA polymerase-3 subunit beta|nr:DNA polymerase III subunit beta [Ignavibacteria bacterium]
MKFSSQLGDFQKLIQKVLPAIPLRAAFDALEHIKLTLDGNILTAVASDIEITIKSSASVMGSEDGEILAPAKMLSDVVKVLDPSKDIVFECDPEDLLIRIISGKSKYQLNAMSGDDYILVPEIFDKEIPTEDAIDNNVATFKKDVLQDLASKTYYAVSADNYRPGMTGVLFQFRENYLNAVGTDSYRLVRATNFAETNVYPKDLDIILPEKAVELCRKLDDDVTMFIDYDKGKPKQVRIDNANTSIVARLLNESFPKYETIIPKVTNYQATFDISEFIAGIKRIVPLAGKGNKCRMEFSTDKLVILAENDERGEIASEEIPCELIDTDSFVVSYNIKFLLEMIGTITANDTTNNMVSFYFISPDKAALIKPKAEKDSLVMILMPMRVY